MVVCTTCGIEIDPRWIHHGAVDCINYARACIANLQGQIADIRKQLPLGEADYIGPIGRDVTARIWFEGKVTPDSIDKLIQVLGLLKDTYPKAEPPQTDS